MIAAGEKLPDVSIMKGTADGPQPLTTTEYFAGTKTVLFAVPGAFTPTCSARHLPGFVDKADEIRAKGVDQIAAMAVNDAFVMAAWGKSAEALGKIDMLADGNGDFTRALGLESDSSQFGMGMRSKRFAMIIEDNVVKDLFVEEAGTFEVSSAEYVLARL